MQLRNDSVAGPCLPGTGRSNVSMTYFAANPRWFPCTDGTNEEQEQQSSAAGATGFNQPKI